MVDETLQNWIPEIAVPHAWTIACLICRFAPWCFFVPIGTAAWIPWRMRLALVVMVVVGLVPMAEDYVISSEAYTPTILPLVMECLLGLAMMITTLVLLRSMSMVATVVFSQTSLGATGQADGSGEGATGSVATLLQWLALIWFLVIGGHRQLMMVCLESLERAPMGSLEFERPWMEQVMELMQSGFVLGTKACLPFGLLLILSNVVGGLASRLLPAIGSIVFGPNTNALLALSMFAVSLGSIGWLFQDQLGMWLEQVHLITSR